MKIEAVTTPGYLKCDVHKSDKACSGPVKSGRIEISHAASTVADGPWDVDMCTRAWDELADVIIAKTQPVTRKRKGKVEATP